MNNKPHVPEWERATPEQWPILFYLCYDSSLAATDSKGRLTGERRYYRMRLPYTEAMLKRREERLSKAETF